MKFIIEIENFENDAMTETSKEEMAKIIKHSIQQGFISEGAPVRLENYRIFDYNGNKVGEIQWQ